MASLMEAKNSTNSRENSSHPKRGVEGRAARENVQLAVREGTEVVFVERIAGSGAVPVLTRVGGRFALTATGVGLVLLAHAPAEVQEEVLLGSGRGRVWIDRPALASALGPGR